MKSNLLIKQAQCVHERNAMEETYWILHGKKDEIL